MAGANVHAVNDLNFDTEVLQSESPVLVVAWPQMYYHNYELLLRELGVGITTLPIQYFVQTPDGHFCQDGKTSVARRFGRAEQRIEHVWRNMIRVSNRCAVIPSDRAYNQVER